MSGGQDLDAVLHERMKAHVGGALLEMFGDDKFRISYRPELVPLAGSVTAAILLAQIVYRAKARRYRSFYKFSQRCQHPQYRRGDSWCEELAFTRREFEGARSRIAVRVGSGDDAGAEEALSHALVLYWVDAQRRTWYKVNVPLLSERLEAVYSGREEGS